MILGFLSLSFKSLAYSAWRWRLTLFAIALGVGGIVTSLSINEALTSALDATARGVLGRADAQIVALDEVGFSEDALATISSLPQISSAAPRLTKNTSFRRGDTRGFLRLTGIDPALDPSLHPMPLVSGQALSASSQKGILVPQTWAQDLNLQVGDQLDLMVGDRFEPFQVEGVVGGVPNLILGGSPQAFITIAAMDANFDALGARISEVSVRYAPGEAPAAAGVLAATLREPYLLRDVAATQAALAGEQRDFRWLLALFGAIALAGSGVQILNMLSILGGQRRRELALLRIAGATRRQVAEVLVLEAMIIGFVGSVAGVALGAFLAAALGGLAQAGRGLQADVGLRPAGAITGLLAGLLVSVVAAMLPAVTVARRPPLDALRISGPREKGRDLAKQMTVGAVLLALLGFVVVALVNSGREASPGWLLAGFAVAILLALLVVLLVVVPMLTRLAGWLLQAFPSGLAHLAQQSLNWRVGRTASTVSALCIAVALLTALLTLAGSASTVGRNAVEALFAAPYVVVAPEPLESQIIQELTQTSGASAASPMRRVTVRWDDTFVEAVALDPQFFREDPKSLPLVEGDREAALTALQEGDALLVSSELARRQHLQLGGTINLWTPDGTPRPFKIAGLLQRSFPTQDPVGALVLSGSALKAYFGVDSFTHLLVRPSGENFQARLQVAAARYGLQVRSSDELVKSIDRALDETLLLFGALTATIAVLGGLSIVNAMNLNVRERAQTLGLLRAAGMTTRQVALMVLVEGLLLGLLAGILGVGLGLGLGWLLFGAGRISQEASFEPRLWIVALVPASGLLALLAAIYPARLAAATSALGAVRHHFSA